jgi:hypothetical protein
LFEALDRELPYASRKMGLGSQETARRCVRYLSVDESHAGHSCAKARQDGRFHVGWHFDEVGYAARGCGDLKDDRRFG